MTRWRGPAEGRRWTRSGRLLTPEERAEDLAAQLDAHDRWLVAIERFTAACADPLEHAGLSRGALDHWQEAVGRLREIVERSRARRGGEP